MAHVVAKFLVRAAASASPLAALASGQVPSPGPLFPLAEYPVGTTPVGIAAADFDLDGRPDLATVNYAASASLSIASGLGDGRLGPAFSTFAGLQPEDLAVGDWNSDGKPDLATAAKEGAWVVLGLGPLGFASAIHHPTGSATRGIAAGDWNGDGTADLVLTNAGAASVGTLLGFGDGAFDQALVSAAGATPRAIAAGDFDADGVLDAVLTDDPTPTFTFLRGRGNGTFHPPSSYPVTLFPYAVAAADVDLDGDLDAVIGHFQTPIDVALGTGDGGFVFGAPLAGSSGNSFGILLRDLDADGDPDLVVPGHGSVYPNVGGGGFGASIDVQLRGPDAVLVDLDGDGDRELAVPDLGSHVGVALGLGGLAFEGAIHAPTFVEAPVFGGGSFGLSTRDLATGDLDTDGWLDVIAASWNSIASVALLYGQGGGALSAPVMLSLDGAPGCVGTVDLDGDGWLDVLQTRGDVSGMQLAVRLGLGGGAFAPQISYAGASGGKARGLALADLDGDGDPDAAVTATVPGTGAVHLGQGDGTLAAGPAFVSQAGPYTGQAAPLETCDLDLDGDLDLLVGLPDSLPAGGVSVLAGAGDGSFAFAQFVSGGASGFAAGSVEAGDLDQDGDLDVVIGDHSHGARVFEGSGSLLLGPGAPIGGFLPPMSGLADLNGDGWLDIACEGLGAVVPGAGGLGFGAPSWFAQVHVTGQWLYPTVEIADLDGNGAPDVLAADVDVYLSRWDAPLVTSVGGLYAGAAGSVEIQGAWLGAGAAVQVDGAAVPVVASSPSSLTVQLGASAPGWKDLQVASAAGATAHAGALGRWPALAGGPAHIGEPLVLALANGEPGAWLLGVAASTGPPLALPGIWHQLELSGPVLLAAGAIGSGASAAAIAIAVPNDPGLVGAGAWFQCWALQAGPLGPATQSFSNALLVTVQ